MAGSNRARRRWRSNVRLSAEQAFQNGSEMGRRVLGVDWSNTPLGAIESWPQSLKTAVRIMLDTRYPTFIWCGDERLSLHNDACIPLLGKRHPWALGQPAAHIWHEAWEELLGPQSQVILKDGKSAGSERVLVAMDRHGYTEEAYFSWSHSPVHDDEGKVIALLCTCTEETEQVLARRRLETLRALSRTAALDTRSAEQVCQSAAATLSGNPHDIPFALLYLLDPSRRRATLEGTMGIEPGAGATPAVIHLNDTHAAWPLARVATSGQTELVEGLAEKFGALPGGAWPECSRAALVLPLTGAGQVAGFLVAGISPRLSLDAEYRAFLQLAAAHIGTAAGCARAAAEERRRVDALAQLERAKADLITNVSQELRTPLTLMLCTQEEALAAPEGVLGGESLRALHDDTQRLLKLVDAFATFSRLESGTAHARYESTDLAALTRDIANAFRPAIEQARLSFHIDCRPLREDAHVDRAMWRSIVSNLLANALNHTFEGSIVLGLRGVGDQFELKVTDSGSGIPERDLMRVFERFHRVEGARARNQNGSGTGLSLVRDLVRLHGGAIHVASEEGSGSTFTVTIPQTSAHLLKHNAPDARDTTPSSNAAQLGYQASQTGAADPVDARDPVNAKRLIEDQARELARAKQEAEAARAAADAANRTRDEFLAMLGHELRNPLAPIRTSLQLMRMRGSESREQAVIERQVDHLVRLVDDLLDISRITRGKVDLKKRRIELIEAVLGGVEMASPLLEERRQHVELNVPAKGLPIIGDADRLAQVVANLITNAAKYSEPGKTIEISACSSDGMVSLEVKDEGIGIPPDMLARVFEPFVQQPQSSERSQGGLGLGLAIVRSIVTLHGGGVSAKSAGVDKGSEFAIRLPLAPAEHAREAQPEPPSARSSRRINDRSEQMRILVVDDNLDAAETLAEILGVLGYEVATAPDGPSALNLTKLFKPNICLLDIGLPVMDGYELAQHLRESKDLPPGARIVAITGYGQETDRRRSMEAGFNAHLVKPVSIDVLTRALLN